MDSPLVLAAALDPQFRKLSFLSRAEQCEVHEILVEKASIGDCSCSQLLDVPPIKKKKPSVLDRLLGEDLDHDKSNSVTENVALCLREHPIQHCDNPFVWWHGNVSHFPHLALVAWHHLGIPATSKPSERVFFVAGMVVDKHSCALSADMINALVFMLKNSSLLNLMNEVPVRPQPRLIPQAQDAKDSDDDDDDDDDDDNHDLPALIHLKDSPALFQD